jgi:hypothetical protein
MYSGGFSASACPTRILPRRCWRRPTVSSRNSGCRSAALCRDKGPCVRHFNRRRAVPLQWKRDDEDEGSFQAVVLLPFRHALAKFRQQSKSSERTKVQSSSSVRGARRITPWSLEPARNMDAMNCNFLGCCFALTGMATSVRPSSVEGMRTTSNHVAGSPPGVIADHGMIRRNPEPASTCSNG